MTTTKPDQPYDVMVAATEPQLRQIASIVGDRNVTRLAMGPDGIAVYLAEGPAILSQVTARLSPELKERARAWPELDQATQRRLAALAAAQADWPGNYTIRPEFIDRYLDENPEMRDAVIRPPGAPV